MSELDEVFESEESVEESQEESQEEPVEETKEDSTEEEESEEESTEEAKGEEESEPPSDEPKLVPIAAVHDYRRKVDELKNEVESLRKQVPNVSNEPDPYEDLDAWKQWHRDQVVQEQEQSRQAELSKRIEESRENFLTDHGDYIQAENAFMVRVQGEPNLRQEMLNSLDPAKFAYEKGMEFINGLMNPVETSTQKPVIVAPSLATATASRSNSAEVEKEEGLDDMFEDQKY